MGVAWEKLCARLGAEGILGQGAKFVGICHDDPEVTATEKIRYDACVTVDDGFEPEAEIGAQTVGGGEYAVTTHIGPYEQEAQTIAAMKAFSEQQGLDFHGRHHEIYLSDPHRVPPERLKTILRQPVRKKQS